MNNIFVILCFINFKDNVGLGYLPPFIMILMIIDMQQPDFFRLLMNELKYKIFIIEISGKVILYRLFKNW